MRIAILADVHLGKRQFSGTTDGRNTREIDTENAWYHAVRVIAELSPDLVLICGDIFDHPRVSDFAKKAFIVGLWDIHLHTRAPMVILQGNHDAGRTAEVLTPLRLPDGLIDKLHIVTTPKRLNLHIGGQVVSVSCFPFVVRGEDKAYQLEPDPDADVNILALHASVKGSADGDSLPHFYGSGDQALDVAREVDRWDLIAVGDFHEFTRLHPTALACYPGSLERTSSNIWQEQAPKGFVMADTESGTLEFHEVETRPMFDYDLDDVLGGSLEVVVPDADSVNECLKNFVASDFLADALVRLKVDDFPREEREHVDWSLVRELKGSCEHMYLDIRYGTRVVPGLGDRRDRRGGMSLAEEAVSFFKEDEEPVRRCAFGYLEIEADVEEVTAE